MPTRPSRVRRHDPILIESLLSRRDAEGLSFARLAEESGIPIGTLAHSSWRRRQRERAGSRGFTELVVREAATAASGPTSRPGQPMFELALSSGRRITIAAGFDSEDLRRLLAIVEEIEC